MQLQHHGRIKIKTDATEITYNNVIDVLRDAYSQHRTNASDIKALIDYEAGEQPLIREKTVRKDIDCHLLDNLAHYITERHLSYDWGCPITITQRGEKDSGGTDEALAISLYNEYNAVDGNESKIQELARFLEICGIGYTYSETVKKKDFEYYESYHTTIILHPMCAFVVYDSMGNRPKMGVSYRHDKVSGNNYFTCITEDRRYEIENLQEIINGSEVVQEEQWNHRTRSGERNPINRIPIVEHIRSHDRTGCFEHVLTELDELNLLVSDYANSVETNVQAIWHTNDIDFTDENGEHIELSGNKVVETQTTRDGKTPFIKPLTLDYDYSGQLANINSTRARILEECDVPNRDTTSGGSTGVAADTITGYAAADEAANKKQLILKGSMMRKLDVDLACIRASSVIEPDNPLMSLRKKDCDISIKRDKNRELTTKINFFATAVSHGIDGLHAITAANIWGDPNQVWEDSQDKIEKYQDSIFNKQNEAEGGSDEQKPDSEKIEQDISDQITNSPNIDGMTTGQAV